MPVPIVHPLYALVLNRTGLAGPPTRHSPSRSGRGAKRPVPRLLRGPRGGSPAASGRWADTVETRAAPAGLPWVPLTLDSGTYRSRRRPAPGSFGGPSGHWDGSSVVATGTVARDDVRLCGAW